MRLSVQLYTLRDPMDTDPWGTLAKVREMGLNYVELAGTYGLDPAEFKSKLDELGLKISGSHIGLDALENDFDNVVASHKALGCDFIVLPWVATDFWKENWKDLQGRAEMIGKKLAAEGIQFAYHNHGFELEDRLLGDFFDGCDPEAVKCQLDLGWVYFAGEDPVEWINRYGSRTPSVHLKDMDMAPDSPDAIAGKGKMEWEPILKACFMNGVPYGSIEMDNPPGDALESVRECVEFFRARGVTE